MTDNLKAEWQQSNRDWTSIGYPHTPFIEWLVSEVLHWRKCALAFTRPGQNVYSDSEIVSNLQQRVNELEAENRRLRQSIVAISETAQSIDFEGMARAFRNDTEHNEEWIALTLTDIGCLFRAIDSTGEMTA